MGEEIRNYRFTYEAIVANEREAAAYQMIMPAYDLSEAQTQFDIKFKDYSYIKVLEVIPFKYIEETAPVVEQKKEVRVKPNPVR